jgi:hypothetical protein
MRSTTTRWKSVTLVASLAATAACGAKEQRSCPDDATAGQTFGCTCDDTDAMGVALCDEDLKLTPCDCASVPPPTTIPMPTATPTPTVGGGDSSPTTSEPSAAPPDPTVALDASLVPDADAGSTAPGETPPGEDVPVVPEPPAEPPVDGEQLARCEDGVDCNRGLDCYSEAPGPSFCSKACATDEDCAEVEGGDYTCSPTSGICRIVCAGADDGACPSGQICRFLNPLAGYRCAYPN